ncbi:MAG TPA: hypothetical protein VK923_11460 [Euzebyales bacterium]|nr:hypothetical protein [Euzebyales bacterium]
MNIQAEQRAACPWCNHFNEPDGCPYLDHVGNLVGDTECPTVCNQPATKFLVLPIGTLPLCGDHFPTARAIVEGGGDR